MLAIGCLALLGLVLARHGIANEATSDPPAAEEPITPIPPPPAADPRRVALGAALFGDVRLSHDNARACTACHNLATNGASAQRHDLTLTGGEIVFNTNTVFNAALSFRLNWEGRFRTLEEQATNLLENPAIMATSVPEVVAKLGADPQLQQQFQAAYGRPIDAASFLGALTTYERTLVTPDSRFDQWLRGDNGVLSEQEVAGYHLFKGLGCISCHQGVNVGGNLFQRHGIFSPLASPNPVIIRVPSLRNVATTAPYFHDGSAPTLEVAVQAMANAQLGRTLSGPQIDEIVAFLKTLTGRLNGRLVVSP